MSKLSDFIPGIETADSSRRGSFRKIDDDHIEFNGVRYKLNKISALGKRRNLHGQLKSNARLRLELEQLDD